MGGRPRLCHLECGKHHQAVIVNGEKNPGNLTGDGADVTEPPQLAALFCEHDRGHPEYSARRKITHCATGHELGIVEGLNFPRMSFPPHACGLPHTRIERIASEQSGITARYCASARQGARHDGAQDSRSHRDRKQAEGGLTDSAAADSEHRKDPIRSSQVSARRIGSVVHRITGDFLARSIVTTASVTIGIGHMVA
jgi:hypothetical protein